MVVYEILSYLVEHPDSQDTIDGIVQWWLLERSIKRQTTKVKEVLTELTAKGLVLENKTKDSNTHYRINKTKYNEIRALLEKYFE